MSLAPAHSAQLGNEPPNAAIAPSNVSTRVNGSTGSSSRTFLVRIVFAVLVVVLWQCLVALKLLPIYVFPAPLDVAKKLIEMARDGSLVTSVRLSMQRMVVGYGISVTGGVLLGIASARSRLFKDTVGSVILSLQSLPSICWLPLALILVGINEQAIIAVVVLGALFSIAVSTEGAIRNVAPIYHRVGRVLGARGWTFAKDILFFAALPELLGGLKLGWTFAWRSLMAAELIRSDILGVGRMLETGRQFNDMAMLFAALIVILVIGLVVDRLVFGLLESRVRRRWGLEK